MKRRKIHLKAKPPNLPSFTACGLWIYEVAHKREKEVTGNREDVTCERCKNTRVYRDGMAQNN